MTTATTDTLLSKPLFVFIDLPAKESFCKDCGQPVRQSITRDHLPVLINSNAKPKTLIHERGHRYGQFPLNQIHSHEANQ